jgi:cyanophycin synthetase
MVGEEALIRGEMTGFESAAMTLRDPTIECALLEVPLETILDRGLGYRFADIAVVLNLRDEGKLYDEAPIMEDIAYAHSVVAEQVYEDGWTVLNADDDLILGMRERLYSSPVLFSRDPANQALTGHAAAGGRAVTVENGSVLVLDRGERTRLAALDEVALLGGEDGGALLDAVLAGAAALYCFGASLERIRETLKLFTAGRGS